MTGYEAVWTCNNPRESHNMGSEFVNSLQQLSSDFTVHDHTTCEQCEITHEYYEGSLDTIYRIDADGNRDGEVSIDTVLEDFSISWY